VSGALYGLAGACVRHRFRATAIWLVLVGVIIVVSNSVGRETSNDLTLPGTGSTQAQDLLQDNLPKEANGTNPVVMETASGTLTTGKNE
jgi:putative drug exporter of the RND superfamily